MAQSIGLVDSHSLGEAPYFVSNIEALSAPITFGQAAGMDSSRCLVSLQPPAVPHSFICPPRRRCPMVFAASETVLNSDEHPVLLCRLRAIGQVRCCVLPTGFLQHCQRVETYLALLINHMLHHLSLIIRPWAAGIVPTLRFGASRDGTDQSCSKAAFEGSSHIGRALS